jgi:hypothetical protein
VDCAPEGFGGGGTAFAGEVAAGGLRGLGFADFRVEFKPDPPLALEVVPESPEAAFGTAFVKISPVVAG